MAGMQKLTSRRKMIKKGKNQCRKMSKLPNLRKTKELKEVNEDGHKPTDIWVMINRVKLTFNLRDTLLSRFGWLNAVA